MKIRLLKCIKQQFCLNAAKRFVDVAYSPVKAFLPHLHSQTVYFVACYAQWHIFEPLASWFQ